MAELWSTGGRLSGQLPSGSGDRRRDPAHGPDALPATALLEHAAALGAGATEKGLDFWATELSGLLLFAAAVLGAGE
jgi:hypothetical protein